MKTRTTALILTLLASGGSLALAEPMNSAFTYQGQLADGTNAASGTYDFRFKIFDALGGGSVVAGPVTNSAIPVSKGLFSTTLDFGGGVFNGEARWLEVAVRTNGATADFVAFEPRQPLTASPYALHAANSSTLGGQPPTYYAPASGSTAYVARSGDTMTGPLSSTYFNFNGNPPLPTTTTGTIFEQANVGPTVSGLGFDVRTGNPPFWDFGSRLRIDASGNVGIGSTSPKSKLEVNGTIGFVPSDFLANDAMDGFWTVKADSTDANKLIFFEKGGGAPGVTTPRLTLTHSGRVGIGTADPKEALHVSSGNLTELRFTSTVSPDAGDWAWGTGWYGAGGSFRNLYLYDYQAMAIRATIDSAGNVGIGTTTPAAKLDVIGTVQATSFQGDASGLTGLNANSITSGTLANARLSANVPLLTSASVSFSGQVSANTLRAGNTSLATTAVQGTAGDSTGVYGASTSGTGVRGYSSSGAGVQGQSVSSYGVYANSGTGYGLAASGGSIGVYAHNTSGTPGRDVYLATPGLAGDFYGDLNIRDSTMFLRGGSNHGLGWYGSGKPFGTNAFDGPVLFGWLGGALGSTGFGPDWSLTWDEWGWVRIRGGLIAPSAQIAGTLSTGILQITGGSDVAEPFELADKDIPKGSVVVIDAENPGQLKLSNRAYDTRVAGIISGANGIQPGLTLRQKGVMDGSQNVALSGRVYALADASNGPIQAGDLLTTSTIPGHAMKVTNHTQAQGAILGKAMSGLAEGQGMVLVLVSLQ